MARHATIQKRCHLLIKRWHLFCPRGSSTLEILIAFVLLSLALTAVISVVFGNQTIGIDTETNTEALYKAQAMLEAERALARQDWDAVVSVAPSPDGIYTKSIDVQSIGSVTKRVTANVLWSTSGRNLAVHLTTLLTDFVSAGNICSETLTGDWKQPLHYDYATVDLLSPVTGNNDIGFSISDVAVYRKKLYLTADSTANTKNTFYIFDLPSDPSHLPAYRGQLNNAPSLSAAAFPVINALALARNYAYIANGTPANFGTCTQSDKCSQLQVVDVSDPASPALVKSFKIPGVTGTSGQGVGKNIRYHNGYVYLGLTKTASGPEFHIIGVHNPLNPVHMGVFPIGRTINSIVVKNQYAYLATTNNTQEVYILDVGTPSVPTLVGMYNATPNDTVGNNSGLGKSLYLSGTKLHFGRTYSFSGSDPEWYILDASNPATALPVLGSKDVGISANPDSVNDIVVRDDLAFLLTNKQFQVWNVADPTTIAPWSSDGTQNTFLSLTALGGTGTAFACDGNTFYAAVASSTNNKDILSVIVPSP